MNLIQHAPLRTPSRFTPEIFLVLALHHGASESEGVSLSPTAPSHTRIAGAKPAEVRVVLIPGLGSGCEPEYSDEALIT